MAYKIISNGDTIQSSVVEIVLDSLDEVDTLPDYVGVGSSCIVLEDGNSSVWMFGNDKHWHQI